MRPMRLWILVLLAAMLTELSAGMSETAAAVFHTPDDIRAIAKEIQGAKGYFLQAYRDSGDILKGGCSRPTDGELHALLSAARESLPNAELRGVE